MEKSGLVNYPENIEQNTKTGQNFHNSVYLRVMKTKCSVLVLGIVEYQTAWLLQRQLAEEIADEKRAPTLLLLEHPHTYTFGRRGKIENLLWDESELESRNVSVHWVDRGGDVTYHGPGQLVGYPLLPLAPGGLFANQDEQLTRTDYIDYLRKLENVIILALMQMGVSAEQIPGLTGVWIQSGVHTRHRNTLPNQREKPAKIASIGVKVDVKGISRHGFALNVAPDMSYWQGIVGCGLEDYPVISLAELVQPRLTMEQVMRSVISAFGEVFDYEMVAEPEMAERLIGKVK